MKERTSISLEKEQLKRYKEMEELRMFTSLSQFVQKSIDHVYDEEGLQYKWSGTTLKKAK